MEAYDRDDKKHTIEVDGSIRSGWMRSIRSRWIGAYGRGEWEHTVGVDEGSGNRWIISFISTDAVVE